MEAIMLYIKDSSDVSGVAIALLKSGYTVRVVHKKEAGKMKCYVLACDLRGAGDAQTLCGPALDRCDLDCPCVEERVAAKHDIREMLAEQGGNLDLCHWCGALSDMCECENDADWRGVCAENTEGEKHEAD